MGVIPHRQAVQILPGNFYYPPKKWGAWPLAVFCNPSTKVAGPTIYLRGCSLADSVLN